MDESKIEEVLHERKVNRQGAKVFCVGCGASKRTLHRWHNSYLCTDCYAIQKRIGDEAFIKALKGEE